MVFNNQSKARPFPITITMVHAMVRLPASDIFICNRSEIERKYRQINDTDDRYLTLLSSCLLRFHNLSLAGGSSMTIVAMTINTEDTSWRNHPSLIKTEK